MKNHLNTILIALAVVTSAYLLGSSYLKSKRRPSSISVTGLASRDFNSDLIVWTARYTKRALNLQDAFNALKMDQEKVKAYLISKGIPEKELVFSAVDIGKEFSTRRYPDGSESTEFSGFRLSQGVTVESKNVDGVERTSREVTELINEGIELYSENPRYYYTRLAAAKDARVRAEKIAENAGADLSSMETGEMGIFQITGQNSNEDYSWGGTFNTSSRNKTASITVRANFALD